VAAKFHPKAARVPGNTAGAMVVDAPKITHHLTVGTSIDGAISAYRDHNGWPHFTCDWVAGQFKIVQHVPLDQAARALRNPGSETNRADTIQIEHVGYPHASGEFGPPPGFGAKAVANWSDERWDAVAELCRWIEANTGCPQARMPGSTWGDDHPGRLGGDAFRTGRGHHGHQHVPGNDHWDPGGRFDIDRILEADPSVHRELEDGMAGPDVRALQVAVNRRATRCGRPDRVVPSDGRFTAETDRGAAWAAFILGVGTSQEQLLSGPLSQKVQRWVRDPSQRNAIQKARAVARRREHCREG
jgi:N-acetylmuramoyl-L-alanine amidase